MTFLLTDGDKPHTVYRFYSDDEELLYVGCTSQGTDRLRAHSSNAEWWTQVSYAHMEHFPDKRSALDRERALIEDCHPRFNKKYRVLDQPPHSKPADRHAPRVEAA
jgi:predicted GIY-YIG superfamily endonuclease